MRNSELLQNEMSFFACSWPQSGRCGDSPDVVVVCYSWCGAFLMIKGSFSQRRSIAMQKGSK
jgi:hypothetical protein